MDAVNDAYGSRSGWVERFVCYVVGEAPGAAGPQLGEAVDSYQSRLGYHCPTAVVKALGLKLRFWPGAADPFRRDE